MTIGNRLLRLLCNVFSLVLCASIAGAASAQSYPNKSIRIIVAATPGGGADTVGRMIGQQLAETWARAVVIDNRPGGGATIGAEIAAKAVADGYTLLVITSQLTISQTLYRKLSYHLVKDFAPITQIAAGAYILAVHPSVPAKTVNELIALAKSKKGGITYASGGGIGSASHLGMELLKTLAGFDAVNVPYKGTAPAIIDLIAGQVDASIATMLGGLPHVRSGKVKALAVTSIKRSLLLPDVPTVAEAGFRGYEVSGWYGLLAPAGTPREVVAKLYEEISRSLKLPDVRDRMVANGADPVGSTP
ncbi:MAG: tripartite tricarboxylate transporter substrate binding protein, partial [Betaproteobacteria bacterium]|nr:tripartite tricarboxylate transporter substrate binding protein [Betaproteobacteria bacterium]